MRPLPSVSPDWGLRGVRPKGAPTRREDRKRDGSSMAAAQVSATIAPTPGVVISRRVGAGEPIKTLLDGLKLLLEPRAGLQKGIGDRLQRVMLSHHLPHSTLEGLGRGWPDLQAKAAQHAAQAHLDIMALGLQKLARGQKGTPLLGRP